jgi:ribosomal 50S subunit-recycling heat shock protein
MIVIIFKGIFYLILAIIYFMRIDKFLNAVNITKRRAVAEDMLEHKVVFINEQSVKKSKEVKVGDIIEIRYLEKSDKFQVLQIPTTKSTPKSKMEEYVKRIENV